MTSNNTNLTILSTAIRQDAEGRYSLNDCHKAAGGEESKSPNRFARSEGYKALVSELTPDLAFAPSSTQKGGTNPGTYACKELVYAYAMWISPSFNLQVIRAFDALVTGQIQNAAPKQIDRITMLRKAIAMHGSALAFNKRQGMDLTQARLKAVATVKEQMGIDLPEELGWQAQPLAIQQRTVNATEIGRALGMKNTEVNQLLESQGYHTGLRDMKLRRVWKPTNKGMKFGRYEDKAKKHSEGTVQPWVWFENIVDELRPFAPTPARTT
ncbi:MAG: KilA-N domain-containing protein [Acetobacter papayae]|uniref:KilA-N domain-containing protein n=1 Tax=Acetobacter papayae TaxID=1076592 RepID=UPI0039EBB1C1